LNDLPLFMGLLSCHRHLGGGDFQKFLGDFRLAEFVYSWRQVFDDLERLSVAFFMATCGRCVRCLASSRIW